MPPIGYLDRIRRTLPHAIGMGTGPVARDDLDSRVLAEPFGQARGLPVSQEIDHRVALQVDQHRAVAMATAPGPVINGEDTRVRLWISAGNAGIPTNQPQQRVRAGQHGQTLGQPSADLAAQRQPDMTLHIAQPIGPPCRGASNIGQALGKGPARAGLIEAAETTRLQVQCHRPALPRQIGEHTAIAAVDVGGEGGAGGT
jgi:hypothetical protein